MTHPKYSVTTLNKKNKSELILIARSLGTTTKGLKAEIIADILAAQAAIEPKAPYTPAQYPHDVEVTDYNELRQRPTPVGCVRFEIAQHGEVIATAWIGANDRYYCAQSDNDGHATLDELVASLTAPSESDIEFAIFMAEPAAEDKQTYEQKAFDLVPCESLEELAEYCDRHNINQSSWFHIYKGCLDVHHLGKNGNGTGDSSVIEAAICQRDLYSEEHPEDSALCDELELEFVCTSEEFDRYDVYDLLGDPLGTVAEYSCGWKVRRADRVEEDRHYYRNECAAALSLCRNSEVEIAQSRLSDRRARNTMPSYF